MPWHGSDAASSPPLATRGSWAGGGSAYPSPGALGVRVINLTGVAIAADKVVAVVGIDLTTQLPRVVLADADLALHMDLYFTRAEIAIGAEATVFKRGLSAANLNTSAVGAAGDPVYLSATAGGFTATPPATGQRMVVGYAVVDSATVGQILWDLSGDAQRAPVFVSAEQTATGAAQNVAHGLGVVPTSVAVIPTSHPGTPDTGAFDVAQGTHTATNVVVTVTVNVTFIVIAMA